MSARWWLAGIVVVVVGACTSSPDVADTVRAPTTAASAPTSTSVSPAVAPAVESAVGPTSATTTPRPDWLGTRVLPIGPSGFGEIVPTPDELIDRRFATVDVLDSPTTERFEPTVGPVPDDVSSRSTWSAACPVALSDLRYLTLPFWGFDGELHTGELLVNADTVDVAVAGFNALFDRRFPIEEMRITTPAELDAAPTGDGNNTGSFVCRPTRGSGAWSEHAYGRAIDINPFHNPYVKGPVVLPELASAYADRSTTRPGMLTRDDVAAFVDAGWGWGGQWRSLKDTMHLSSNGR